MTAILTNWKTSLAGALLIVLSAIHTLLGVDIPGVTVPDLNAGTLAMGLGLLLAKDGGAVDPAVVKKAAMFLIGFLVLRGLVPVDALAQTATPAVVTTVATLNTPAKSTAVMPIAAPPAPACTNTSCTGWFVGGDITGSGSNMNILGSGIAGSVFAGGGGLGLNGGFQFWNGTYYFAADLFADYMLANSQVAPGVGNQNAWLLGEFADVGLGISSIFGTTPNTAPVTIPQSIANALLSPYVKLGMLERPWGTAWATGAGAAFILAQNWLLKTEYIYATYGNATVNPGQTQKTDNLIRVKLDYKF
jgi:hypothetical protein